LKIKKIAILTPYDEQLSASLVGAFRELNLGVPAIGFMDLSTDLEIVAVPPQQVEQAAVTLLSKIDVDGLFVACNALRVVGVIDQIEAKTHKPVLTATQLSLWYALRRANYLKPLESYGVLMGS
jgi:maleate isomerase